MPQRQVGGGGVAGGGLGLGGLPLRHPLTKP